MPEQHIDVKEQIQKMGEMWDEFRKSSIVHLKNMDIEVLEWSFNVGKNGKDHIIEMKAKVAVREKK
jgi:hypothetical protein